MATEDYSSNDTVRAVIEFNARHGGSRIVVYRELRCVVPMPILRRALRYNREQRASDPDGLRNTMRQVVQRIGELNALSRRGDLSPTKLMTLTLLLAAWFADEVESGRQSLELH